MLYQTNQQDEEPRRIWRDKQRYLANVMVALEADKLPEEERIHLRAVLDKCFDDITAPTPEPK